MAIKLSTLVAKGDSNHPYMRNFQYQRLQEKLQLYLDHFLAENPSDFLLKVTGGFPQHRCGVLWCSKTSGSWGNCGWCNKTSGSWGNWVVQ